MSIEHLQHSNHPPVNLSEIISDDEFFDRRHPGLEGLRHLVLTTKDLVEAIQNQWPYDRPMPPDLQAKLSFDVHAIARVRNGDMRRMAENVQS